MSPQRWMRAAQVNHRCLYDQAPPKWGAIHLRISGEPSKNILHANLTLKVIKEVSIRVQATDLKVSDIATDRGVML